MNKRIKEDIVQILDNYEIDEFSMDNEEDFNYLVKNLVDYVKKINNMKMNILKSMKEENEIRELIEFILQNDKERNINFLKLQSIDELEDIKDNIINI